QLPAIRLQGPLVSGEELEDTGPDLVAAAPLGELVDRHDQRGIRNDASLAIDLMGQLGERLQTVFRSCLRGSALDVLRLLLVLLTTKLCDHVADVHPRVPDV